MIVRVYGAVFNRPQKETVVCYVLSHIARKYLLGIIYLSFMGYSLLNFRDGRPVTLRGGRPWMARKKVLVPCLFLNVI